MYDGWPYDGPSCANVDIIPFLPIQLSRHPQPLTTFPQNEALGTEPILCRARVYLTHQSASHNRKDHILDIHLALAPQIHVYVTQPILLSLSPLLLAAPAPQIIGAAPGIPVSAGLPNIHLSQLYCHTTSA